MLAPETGRNEDLDQLPRELATLVPKERFGLAIDQTDATLSVDDDHAVGGSLEEAAQTEFACLRLLEAPFADSDIPLSCWSADAAHRDVDGNQSAIFAPPEGFAPRSAGFDRLRQGLKRLVTALFRDDQGVDRTTDYLVGCVAEERFSASAPGEDAPVERERDERICGFIEQLLGERRRSICPILVRHARLSVKLRGTHINAEKRAPQAVLGASTELSVWTVTRGPERVSASHEPLTSLRQAVALCDA